MVEQITVDLGDRSYPIYIGEGMFGQLPALLTANGISGRLMVITNQVVAKLHANAVIEALKSGGFQPELIVIPDGEAYKSLTTAGKLYESLAKHHAERGTPVLALGGGVIGDLSGFVAATYQRGVPFIQLPTTLLAQVDSSIGGKVAINVGKLKNMAGAFYQPKLVVSDTAVLKTLPLNEIQNGLAEVIKCAVIRSPELFDYLEQSIPAVFNKDMSALTRIVGQAAEVKARIVEKDERDSALRQVLNFGHTLGHAVENASNFGIKHGTAVALGMAAASRLANRMGLLAEADLKRITGIISGAGLPVSMPVQHPQALIEAMQHDKKIAGGKVKFILPTGIGSVTIRDDIDQKLAVEALSL
jgi:3-dehydroquinate synthase